MCSLELWWIEGKVQFYSRTSDEAGITVDFATLKVGDYVISSNTAVERNSPRPSKIDL